MEAVWLTSTALPREKESIMIQVTDGHCGMCVHFGEHDTQHQEQLVEIRDTKVAPGEEKGSGVFIPDYSRLSG
jgi:hypothetical protein